MDAESISIRAAHLKDLPHIFKLLETYDLPTEGLARHLNSLRVATQKEKIVGCAALEIYGTSGLLRSVAVAKPLRGLGIGQRLTKSALALANKNQIKSIFLLTLTAKDFFRKFGFQKIARSEAPKVIQNSVEFSLICCSSATVMRLILSQKN